MSDSDVGYQYWLFLTMCPTNRICLLIIFRRFLDALVLWSTSSFDNLSVHAIRNMRRKNLISVASNCNFILWLKQSNSSSLYFNCRLKAYTVFTFFGSFRNKSGKPQPIRTTVGTHARIKGRQRLQNFGRDRLSGGEMGGSKCPRRRFFCKQYEMTFRQRRNGRFSPNLATTREPWAKCRFWT